jgi:Spy/CpxP family protein refolding chaperone
MNYFLKNRLIFWLLIFLVIINLTALITFMVIYSTHKSFQVQQSQGKPGMIFRQELSLTPSQSAEVDSLMAVYRKSTDPVREHIRDYRVQLLDELAKDHPDTTVMNGCIAEITVLQKQMQKASVNQYLALKGLCSPEQCQRLSELYFELYGCLGKEKGMGKGKGKMHQYRGDKIAKPEYKNMFIY